MNIGNSRLLVGYFVMLLSLFCGNTYGQVCINSKHGNRNDGKDRGCDKTTPFCVMNDGSDPGADQPGQKCVSCINSEAGTGEDNGCSSSAPICSPTDRDGSAEPASGFGGNNCIKCTYTTCDGNCISNTGCIPIPPRAEVEACFADISSTNSWYFIDSKGNLILSTTKAIGVRRANLDSLDSKDNLAAFTKCGIVPHITTFTNETDIALFDSTVDWGNPDGLSVGESVWLGGRRNSNRQFELVNDEGLIPLPFTGGVESWKAGEPIDGTQRNCMRARYGPVVGKVQWAATQCNTGDLFKQWPASFEYELPPV